MDEAEIRRQAQQLLQELGPAHVEELASRLGERLGDELDAVVQPSWLHQLLLDDLEDEFAAFPLADGRLCDLGHLVDGLTLTHRLDDEEREHGVVTLDPDLSPLHLLSPDGRTFPLTGGRELTYADEGVEQLTGPPGWLPNAPVLVARIVDGAIELDGAPEVPEPNPLTAERLARAFEVARQNDPVLLDVPELLVEARARHPRLLARVDAPLAQLLAAAGLEVSGERLHLAGEPAREEDEGVDELVEHLREGHGFSDDEVAAVTQLLTDVDHLLRRLTESFAGEAPVLPPEELVAETVGTQEAGEHLLAVLSDQEVTLAVAHDVLGSEALAAICLLGLLKGSGVRFRDRRVRANAHWLTARALELTADDHREAEREFRQAHESDAHHAEAIVDLARYVSDRGQAGAALGLLRLVEGDDLDPFKEMLERYAQPGPMSAGRNDPCPCGSGRKHKVCCQARGGWPLTDRIDWIWDKVVGFAALPVAEDLIVPVALAARSEIPGPPAMQDVTVANLVMFEGGLIEELCELRGDLLPPDELALLRDWQEVRAGAYEAVEVDPVGHTVTLLDLLTGARTTVHDRSMSRHLSGGEALLAWLLPTPDGALPSGGVTRIPDHHRSHVLDLLDAGAGALELGEWYASLSAPPRLATTDGDPLVFVTLTYRVSDTSAARDALAERLEPDGDQLVSLTDEAEGNRRLRGSISFEGDELVVSTNSASRAVWFHQLLGDLVPDAELIDEERIPAHEAMDETGESESDDELLDLDTLDPAARADVEAQLDEMMVRHEDAWVDSELPALDGATPREAADDPTRRPALLRLLDEFEEHARHWDSPGRPMDAKRLRRLLGL